jgi:hypothetical protein
MYTLNCDPEHFIHLREPGPSAEFRAKRFKPDAPGDGTIQAGDALGLGITVIDTWEYALQDLDATVATFPIADWWISRFM